jgi:hypothetical protein
VKVKVKLSGSLAETLVLGELFGAMLTLGHSLGTLLGRELDAVVVNGRARLKL